MRPRRGGTAVEIGPDLSHIIMWQLRSLGVAIGIEQKFDLGWRGLGKGTRERGLLLGYRDGER